MSNFFRWEILENAISWANGRHGKFVNGYLKRCRNELKLEQLVEITADFEKANQMYQSSICKITKKIRAFDKGEELKHQT